MTLRTYRHDGKFGNTEISISSTELSSNDHYGKDGVMGNYEAKMSSALRRTFPRWDTVYNTDRWCTYCELFSCNVDILYNIGTDGGKISAASIALHFSRFWGHKAESWSVNWRPRTFCRTNYSRSIPQFFIYKVYEWYIFLWDMTPCSLVLGFGS
jgi:hypothetical protein